MTEFLLFIIVVFDIAAIIVFLLHFSKNKNLIPQKENQGSVLHSSSSVKIGDSVVFSEGLIGTIIAEDGYTWLIKISADNTIARCMKSAKIQRIEDVYAVEMP